MTTIAPVRPDHRPVDTPTVPPTQPPGPGRLRRLTRGPDTDPAWARPALLVLLAGTALLYLWDLSASGYANSFYAAAVQAGTNSWKAWLFGSLDSGNSITVDKPPAALWVMGLSARIFGFNSWSLLVPQALEGVASVALLYGAVRRVVGARAGLVAGAALALTPAAVLMFRFDNPDALLTLLLTAGAYAMTRAIERPSARWVSLAGAALGFAFLTKMLQGLLVLPVFALVYLVLAPTSFRRRLAHVAVGAVSLIVSAGWYLALVTLWPAGSRPYIGGSTDNNILELAFGYNGFGRLLGGEGNGGGGSGTAGSSFGGATGLTRLFSSEMGNEISWLLPAALVALVGGLVVTRHAPRTDRTRAALLLWGGWLLITALVFSYMKGTIHPYYTVALAPAIAASAAIGVAALWRRRDSIVARVAMALTVAASGAWGFVLLDRVATWLPALRWTVAVLTVVATAVLLLPPGRIGAPVRRVGIVAALVASLLGTGSFAVATAAQPHTGSIPSVGPSVAQTSGMGGMGGGMGGSASGGRSAGSAPSGSKGSAPSGTRPAGQRPSGSGSGSAAGAAATRSTGSMTGGSMTGSTSAALIKALKATSGTWAAAVSGDQTAAELELATGKAVIAIGGWSGSDNSPTLAQFEAWVKAGRIGYYISSGSGGTSAGGNGGSGVATQIAAWVAKHYTATTIGGSTVYKLN